VKQASLRFLAHVAPLPVAVLSRLLMHHAHLIDTRLLLVLGRMPIQGWLFQEGFFSWFFRLCCYANIIFQEARVVFLGLMRSGSGFASVCNGLACLVGGGRDLGR
jgi:hypothetical protein